MDELLRFLIDGAQKAGPFASVIMTALWWLERSNRLELQRERDGLLERVLKGINDATQSVRDIRHLLARGSRDDND